MLKAVDRKKETFTNQLDSISTLKSMSLKSKSGS